MVFYLVGLGLGSEKDITVRVSVKRAPTLMFFTLAQGDPPPPPGPARSLLALSAIRLAARLTPCARILRAN